MKRSTHDYPLRRVVGGHVEMGTRGAKQTRVRVLYLACGHSVRRRYLDEAEPARARCTACPPARENGAI